MSSPRCTVVRLGLTDLDRAVDDPKLAALLAEGWRPIAHIAISEDAAGPYLAVVLAPPAGSPADRWTAFDWPDPPPPGRPGPAVPPEEPRRFDWVGLALGAAVGAAFGLLGAILRGLS